MLISSPYSSSVVRAKLRGMLGRARADAVEARVEQLAAQAAQIFDTRWARGLCRATCCSNTDCSRPSGNNNACSSGAGGVGR